MSENSEDLPPSSKESALLDILKDVANTNSVEKENEGPEKSAEEVNTNSEISKEECSDKLDQNNESSPKVKSSEKKSGNKNKFCDSDSSSIIISESMFQPKSKKPKRNKHVSFSAEINISKEGQQSSNQHEMTESPSKNGNKNKLPVDDLPVLMRSVVNTITSEESMEESNSGDKLFGRELDDETLCDSCRWLVKAAQSTDSMDPASEEDREVEEIMKKWTYTSGLVVEGKKVEVPENEAGNYTEEQVKKLLDTVHSNLLKSCILITADKLQKTARKPSTESVSATPSDNDVLLNQLQDDGDDEEKMSKLSGALVTFVSKYLKCADF